MTAQQTARALVFADVSDHVRVELDRSSVTELIGTDAYFEDLEEARNESQRNAA